MPLFRYKAIDGSGETIDGRMEAQNSAAVIDRLQELGHLPIEAIEITPTAGGGTLRLAPGSRVKDKHITLFTRELSMLLTAGLPLERALGLLSQQDATPSLAALAGDILTKVRAGNSLSGALEAQSAAFPPIYINLVRAGEVSGSIEDVLMRLAEFREKAEKLRQSLTGAMIYPAILIAVSAISVILLLTFVVPQFEQLFADAGAALPVSTQIVVAAARWCQSYGWVLILLLLLALPAFRLLRSSPPARARLDRLLLRLPLIRHIVITAATGRFCRTLGTLLSNGVELPTALALSRDTVENSSFADALDYVLACVRDGRSLTEPLEETGVIPALSLQMLRVGEETGNLAKTLTHVAEINEDRLETLLKRLIGILEPALVIGIGVIIAGIIASILVAVVSVNDLAF